MDSHARHCPFLNRSDPRCGGSLSLDRLPFAFQFCCNDYHACGVYAELLTERRLRHVAGLSRADTEVSHASPTIQVTVARRFKKQLSAPAELPVVSGLRTGTGG